jgi:prepilin-type N-terminal cleavage/methylation domain-containing protein
MQKLLKRDQQGFTLVELLVAIAIIAILAIIGLTVFTGLQRGARDATRRSDVQAISKAMEANYNTTGGQYAPLATSMFAGGVIPHDPLDTTNNCSTNYCGYCMMVQVGGALPNPTGSNVTNSGGASACGTGTAASGGSANGVVSNGAPGNGNVTGYIICANLETGGTSGPTSYYCQGSQR